MPMSSLVNDVLSAAVSVPSQPYEQLASNFDRIVIARLSEGPTGGRPPVRDCVSVCGRHLT